MPSKLSVLTSSRMLGLHALAVLATTAAVLLGLWQYDVWGLHRHSSVNAIVHAQPKWLGSVMGADTPYPGSAVGQPVRLTGRWLPGDSFYVSGRWLHGRSGYWAVTPVAVCDAHGPSTNTSQAGCGNRPAMLVVRGWTRTVTHPPRPPHGAVDVSGWLQPAEGAGGVDRNTTDDVLPQLRIADVIQRVHQDLYGAYVISRTPTASLAGVSPPSQPKPGPFTGLRNLLYALEWWVFGGFAVYLWWRWCTDELKRAREDGGDGDHANTGPPAALSPRGLG